MPLGPTFRFTQAMVANGTLRPLQDQAWIYRVLPFNAMIYLSVETSGANEAVMTFSAGSDVQAGPDQPIQGGATAGIFQQDINMYDTYLGSAGDELQLVIREVAGGTDTVNIVLRLQPV